MKFLATILLVLAFPAMAVINNGISTSIDSTGAIKMYDKMYVNVKNGSGSALTAGMVVSLLSTGDDGFTVTTGTDNTDVVPFCMVVEALAANAVGKCQVWGYTDILLYYQGNRSATTAGWPVYISSDSAGYAMGIGAPTSSNYKIGIFYDSSAASGAVEAFIMMP